MIMKKLILITFLSTLFFACSNDTASTETNDIEETESAQLTVEEIEKYAEIGFNYALSTKGVLGKNLTNALMNGGPENALEFCNTQAIPLTDSMSLVHNAFIRRATDLARNPDNKANEMELEQITYYKRLVAEGKTGKEIQPNVKLFGDKVHVFYPIITNEMCLQCHGVKNETVAPTTLAAISKYYPNDEATGYQDNEVRGIWNVILDK